MLLKESCNRIGIWLVFALGFLPIHVANAIDVLEQDCKLTNYPGTERYCAKFQKKIDVCNNRLLQEVLQSQIDPNEQPNYLRTIAIHNWMCEKNSTAFLNGALQELDNAGLIGDDPVGLRQELISAAAAYAPSLITDTAQEIAETEESQLTIWWRGQNCQHYENSGDSYFMNSLLRASKGEAISEWIDGCIEPALALHNKNKVYRCLFGYYQEGVTENQYRFNVSGFMVADSKITKYTVPMIEFFTPTILPIEGDQGSLLPDGTYQFVDDCVEVPGWTNCQDRTVKYTINMMLENDTEVVRQNSGSFQCPKEDNSNSSKYFPWFNSYDFGPLRICKEDGVCMPGDEQSESCQIYGTKIRVCQQDCTWPTEWQECIGGGVCRQNDTESQSCGNCNLGTQTRTCTTEGEWGAWGDCVNGGACVAGENEEQDCGRCGKQSRSCSDECGWSEWSTCSEELDENNCCEGDTQETTCGLNNRAPKTRTCERAEGTEHGWKWGSWKCDEKDECGLSWIWILKVHRELADEKGWDIHCGLNGRGDQLVYCEDDDGIAKWELEKYNPEYCEDDDVCEDNAEDIRLNSCGYNGNATKYRKCTEGQWGPESCINDPHVCTNSPDLYFAGDMYYPNATIEQISGISRDCGLNGNGDQFVRCENGQWKPDHCDDPDPCRIDNGDINGDLRTIPNGCGLNMNGERLDKCVEEQAEVKWKEISCEDPDVCVYTNGVETRTVENGCGLNGRGTRKDRCVQGQWDDISCDDHGEVCRDGVVENRSNSCGLNGRGTAKFICEEGKGKWKTLSCTDYQNCIDNEIQTLPGTCGYNGRGYRYKKCVAGHWRAQIYCFDPNGGTDPDNYFENGGIVFSREASEETGGGRVNYVYCSNRSLISGFNCRYHNCDNISIGCKKHPIPQENLWWTDYFSEEGSATESCYPGLAIGIQCKGKLCDNIRLLCTEVLGEPLNSCKWTTEWFSEEEKRILFDEDYYLSGIRCRGNYCDDKQFYICKHTMCESDSHCRFGKICKSNQCRSGCRLDEQCNLGKLCHYNQCRRPCNSDSDCSGGDLCSGGFCYAY